jgi:hypothetical protein
MTIAIVGFLCFLAGAATPILLMRWTARSEPGSGRTYAGELADRRVRHIIWKNALGK